LDKITNNYDTLIGKGAFAMVFMGTTPVNKRVAVKRSTIKDKELRDTYNSKQWRIQKRTKGGAK
jgi:hypothetical protein